MERQAGENCVSASARPETGWKRPGSDASFLYPNDSSRFFAVNCCEYLEKLTFASRRVDSKSSINSDIFYLLFYTYFRFICTVAHFMLSHCIIDKKIQKIIHKRKREIGTVEDTSNETWQVSDIATLSRQTIRTY